MTHGSLFSGIGGFDLAAHWAGWTNIFQVEWNAYCQKILQKNFPDARIYSDIRDFDGTEWRGKVDVISGGFPCQPYSSAGKRKGKEDERHLWPEMLRVIQEAAPRWVVGENVRGLIDWSGGLVFDEVQSDLEASGYEVQAFVLPAASTGAPHQRQRIWFVAYSKDKFLCKLKQKNIRGQNRQFAHNGKNGATANTNNQRQQEQQPSTFASRSERLARSNPKQWAIWPTQPPICGGNDGISNRVDRIAALGNAVVPQLVWRIFDTINQFETQTK